MHLILKYCCSLQLSKVTCKSLVIAACHGHELVCACCVVKMFELFVNAFDKFNIGHIIMDKNNPWGCTQFSEDIINVFLMWYYKGSKGIFRFQHVGYTSIRNMKRSVLLAWYRRCVLHPQCLCVACGLCSLGLPLFKLKVVNTLTVYYLEMCQKS